MCNSPITIRIDRGDYTEPVEVGCHECWQCIERSVGDWVGRNIAESKTAIAANAITLTYGRDIDPKSSTFNRIDHPRARVLTYSDVQKYFKRLRKNGYPCRYFVTGEYGAMKARAHWHVMVYWLGDVPEHRLRKRFRNKLWPYGFQFWDQPSPGAIRYNCKYIQKDQGDDEKQGKLMMSKKPPLGTEYFLARAEQFVEQGLSPRDLFYSWREVTRPKKDGSTEIVKFQMKGAVKDLFLRHFVTVWQATYPGRHFPASEVVDAWQDKEAKRERERDDAIRAYEEAVAFVAALPRRFKTKFRLGRRRDFDGNEFITETSDDETRFGQRQVAAGDVNACGGKSDQADCDNSRQGDGEGDAFDQKDDGAYNPVWSPDAL